MDFAMFRNRLRWRGGKCPGGNPLAVELLSGEGKKSRFLEGELCGNWFGSEGNHDSIYGKGQQSEMTQGDTAHVKCFWIIWSVKLGMVSQWIATPRNPIWSFVSYYFLASQQHESTWGISIVLLTLQFADFMIQVPLGSNAQGFVSCLGFMQREWHNEHVFFFDTTVLRTSSNVHWSIVSRWQGEGKEGDS